jgi:serine/threonine protein kinase
MSLSTGTKLGPYEIVGPLGSGGMGEVYRARDPRLGRDVALKVLPPAFAQDPERMARFEREAQVLASLNHPNISALYGLEESDGVRALVLELVEGPTLADRMAPGPLPLEEALPLARQIAEALEEAHDKGVTHRDLKPANVKVRPDGTVKVLDFGLAKALGDDPAASNLENSPTRSVVSPTRAGVILGTAAYMSPEQAKGLPVDRRTDIWAFGVVLAEMLSGRRMYTGATAFDIMASVVRDEPAIPEAPPGIQRLLRRCLEKDPRRRLQAIGEARLLLEDPHHSDERAASPPPVPRARRLLPWAVAGLFFLATLVVSVAYFRRPPPEEAPVTKFTLLPPENTSFNEIAVSPDGRRVAFTARAASGTTQLWVRPLDSLSAQPLAGTEGASLPFWSPDSRSLGFFAAGKLKKVEASGGPPQTLFNAAVPRGGAWNRDGVIIFSPNGGAPLYRVSAAGGEPQPVTALDPARQETGHIWPQFLPDGQHFLFFAPSSQPENTGIYLASLDSKTPTRVLGTTSSAAYASGYLLYLRERTLLAQPFDLASFATAGEAVPVAEPVQIDSLLRARFSLSQSGVLVYDSSGSGSSSRLLWFDRAGKPLGSVGDPGDYTNLNLSPDDQRVAAARRDPQTGRQDIWLFDLSRGGSSRFTFGPGSASSPVWSSDGSRIAFFSIRDGPYNLYQKLSSGAGSDEPLLKSSNNKYPLSWSPDGRFLLYAEQDPKMARRSLWILPLEGGGKPFPFLRTAFNGFFGQFSSDGRWTAYTTDESGREEVYVRPFSGAEAGAGGKWLISNNGGSAPLWRRDGKELFYLAPDNQLMAVEVQSGAAALQASVPQPLFQTRAAGIQFRYAVTADGRRFLVNSAAEQAASAPATVVLNWTAGLKR